MGNEVGDHRSQEEYSKNTTGGCSHLVRGSPFVPLASLGKAAFCLIITTKSHGVLRKGDASKMTKTEQPNQLEFGLGAVTALTAGLPQPN